jgi:hypothetical protein
VVSGVNGDSPAPHPCKERFHDLPMGAHDAFVQVVIGNERTDFQAHRSHSQPRAGLHGEAGTLSDRGDRLQAAHGGARAEPAQWPLGQQFRQNVRLGKAGGSSGRSVSSPIHEALCPAQAWRAT